MKRVLSAIPLLLASAMAFSWGGTGHQLVAAVAWQKLDKKTKVAVANILVHGDIVSGSGRRAFEHKLVLPAANYAEMSETELDTTVGPVFMQASVWMDDIKGGKSQNWESLIDSLNAASPGISDVHGNEATRCKSWHYLDLPIVPISGGVVAGSVQDHPYSKSNADYALTQVIFPNLKPIPADAPDGANKAAVWMFMAEHIIGDIHQPLHASSLFDQDHPNGDAGGNLFSLDGRNLHSLWDGGVDSAIANDPDLQDEKDLAKVAAAWLSKPANLPTPEQVKDLTPMNWLKDSQDLAIKWTYAGLKQNDKPSGEYMAHYHEVCRKQAILAGFRLAEILKKYLGS